MDTTIVKLLLAVAILFVLWKIMGRRGGLFGGATKAYGGPRPHYAGELYTDEDEEDEYEDEEDQYEDEEEGFQSYGASNPLMSASAALLPKTNAQLGSFSEFAPKTDVVKNQNLLDPSKFVGVNTLGASMKNSNYDLRSAPGIQRRDVGPWMQSSIEPDPYRKPLE